MIHMIQIFKRQLIHIDTFDTSMIQLRYKIRVFDTFDTYLSLRCIIDTNLSAPLLLNDTARYKTVINLNFDTNDIF